ncbi:MAG: hypothetical protein K6346_07160, partial [Halothiobacillaceae bacterium]
FNMEDLKTQLEQMLNMGGMASLLDKLPGVSKLPEHVKAQANDREVKRMIAIIQSMTPQERRHPNFIKGSRKRRIAAGVRHAKVRKPLAAVADDGRHGGQGLGVVDRGRTAV